MAELHAVQEMMRSLEHQIRANLIQEVKNFVDTYHFHYGGADVIRADQLLDHLARINNDQR